MDMHATEGGEGDAKLGPFHNIPCLLRLAHDFRSGIMWQIYTPAACFT